ncbi:uncharacterized protein LOC115480442 [Microcaecilia unicolor]|uniref:Uncharacterized protein LOC115480442 n=1 Tax=Microcaecilia unicolor TaxID=1415580 RepID=A0A6P7ZES9_9AMPH|nr:uncharacterized protein LOC115480442 [Microcaecilia unicolor]
MLTRSQPGGPWARERLRASYACLCSVTPAGDGKSLVTMATVTAGTTSAAGGDLVGHACLYGEGYAAVRSSMKTEAEASEGFGAFEVAGDNVQWGEFLASSDQTPHDEGQRDEDKEGSGVQLPSAWGSQDWSSADSWRPFSDEEDGTNNGPSLMGGCRDPFHCGQGRHMSQGKGPWWLDSISKDEQLEASESVSSHNNVEGLFQKCFPIPSFISSRPYFTGEDQTLEKLLSSEAGSHENQESRQAIHFWRSIWDSRSTFKLGCSRPGLKFLQAYLTSLNIDPIDTDHAVHANPAVDFPSTEQKRDNAIVLSSVSRCEQELKLSKGAGIFVHLNGFRPSHHLQALFQQWTQSTGKKKLKLAYEFNRSLLV